MSYFRELPNISYVSLLPNQNRSDERIEVKNLFKRAKLRTDVDQSVTSFDYYLVQDNERPDIIAQKIYEDPNLDWVILVTNNITSIRNQWPLSNNELYQYCLEKYGSDLAVMQTKHFETQEVKDNFGRILLKKGLIVDENFKFTYPAIPGGSIFKTSFPIAITNYQHELKLNDAKSQIQILDKKYVFDYDNEVRTYAKNLEPSASFADNFEADVPFRSQY